MKLYTREQLLNTIKSIRHYDDWFGGEVADERIEKHLKALAPIELPTEDEIEEYLKTFPYTKHLDDGQYNDGVIVGAELAIEWMKEQINNKVNENNNN